MIMLIKVILLTHLIVSCSSVSLQLVHSFTDGAGFFCTKIHPTSPAPEYLNAEQRLLWYSTPSMIIEMYVETFMGDKFLVRVTAAKINNKYLSTGTHDVQVYNTTTSKKIHKMDVYFDNEHVTPTIQEKKYHTTDSTFSVIKVFYKGPLEFKWNSKCEDSFFGSLKEPEETTTKKPTTVSTSSETTTKLRYYITETNPIQTTPSQEEGESGLGRTTTIVLGCVFGGIFLLIVVIIISVSICVCKKRSGKKKHTKMIMSTEAERNKQAMIQDAKRLSYQEQIKWTSSAVDAGVVYYPTR